MDGKKKIRYNPVKRKRRRERGIIVDNVRMILCGNVEVSRVNPSEKVGVVSVVFVSADEKQIKRKLEELQEKNPEGFYMKYVEIKVCIGFFADKFSFVNGKFTVSAFQKFYKNSIIKQQQHQKG